MHRRPKARRQVLVQATPTLSVLWVARQSRQRDTLICRWPGDRYDRVRSDGRPNQQVPSRATPPKKVGPVHAASHNHAAMGRGGLLSRTAGLGDPQPLGHLQRLKHSHRSWRPIAFWPFFDTCSRFGQLLGGQECRSGLGTILTHAREPTPMRSGAAPKRHDEEFRDLRLKACEVAVALNHAVRGFIGRLVFGVSSLLAERFRLRFGPPVIR